VRTENGDFSLALSEESGCFRSGRGAMYICGRFLAQMSEECVRSLMQKYDGHGGFESNLSRSHQFIYFLLTDCRPDDTRTHCARKFCATVCAANAQLLSTAGENEQAMQPASDFQQYA